MIFSEIYGVYYNSMAALINAAIAGELNLKNCNEIINSEAFRDSFIYISDCIKNESWKLIDSKFTTPIKHDATMPITGIAMRFMKTVMMDKRFKLFYEGILPGLEDIEPLYTEDDICIFDKMKDGDPYEDGKYTENFRVILKAIKDKKVVHVSFFNRHRKLLRISCTPLKFEYSSKDDKFRVICCNNRDISILNMARIVSVTPTDIQGRPVDLDKREKSTVVINITDTRNALKRCMLLFACYEKETTKIDKDHYVMKLTYYTEDETELLIRILSFGPVIKVASPVRFIQLIRVRLTDQMKLDEVKG